MAKICMISVNHSPLDDRIFYKEALSLKDAGHELSMICRADENGIMYDMGNTKALNDTGVEAIFFQGIPAYPIKSPQSFSNRILKKIFKGSFYSDYISKGISINADVYHAHEPESYYLGLQIAAKTGAKVIFDSHESFTTGTKKEQWIKKRYLKDMRYLISANHLTRGYLVGLNPKIESAVIYNAAEPRLYTSDENSDPQVITIAHDGYLPFNRGLVEMLEAFHKVHTQHKNTRLKLIGATTGKEKAFLENFIQIHNLKNIVTETGWLPYEEVSIQLEKCDIGLIAKTNTVNNIIGGPPIKYYNYTAAGMAVVDVNMPETSRLLSTYKNGLSIPDRSSKSLAEGLSELIKDRALLKKYKANSRKAFATLNWEVEATKLNQFYLNVVLNTKKIVKH